MIKRAFLPLLLIPVLVAASAANLSVGDWGMKTDQLDILQSGQFTAPDHVTLTRSDGSIIQADRAAGNYHLRQATLTGNVVLFDKNGALTSMAGQAPSHRPGTLQCDQLSVDDVKKIYIATGHVHFTQGQTDVHADRAVMNGVTHDIHLSGNVEIKQ